MLCNEEDQDVAKATTKDFAGVHPKTDIVLNIAARARSAKRCLHQERRTFL